MQQTSLTKCPLEIFKQRAFLLQKIRQYFLKENVLEVETPIISTSGNTDINIESFTTQAITHSTDISYLRTSPEFPLKRLLASGIGDIYEIGKVFRQKEISSTHNIEFTLLEWYRVGYDYQQLIQDVIDLFHYLFVSFNRKQPVIKLMTYQACFHTYLDIDVVDVSVDQLNIICKKFNYSGSQLNKNESLDYLFVTQIQPSFDDDSLVFVSHYPASQAALAQIDPKNHHFSLRFEVFYHNQELGNGYQELTDPKELLKRFEDDNKYRINNQKPPINIDKNFIQSIKTMPECSGIAVGIDRLLMVLLNKTSINELLSFTAENA